MGILQYAEIQVAHKQQTMKTFEIKANEREALGKNSAKSLRKNEMIPCVLYGGEENVHFYAHQEYFKKLVYTPEVYDVSLNVDGKTYRAVMQDIQFHPVTDKVIHVDFYQVTEGKPITMKVPVHLYGLAKGIAEGGRLNLHARYLLMNGVVDDIPDKIEINVEDMSLGDTVKVKDLSFDKIELMNNPNMVVASVRITRVSKGMDLDAEEEVPAEGEEAATETEGEEKGEESGAEEKKEE